MLSNCPNFRDLGGLAVSEGRTVARGRVFRSGTLAFLGDADHDVLAPFGIKTICDLRHISEREREPTRWRDRDVAMLNWEYRSPLSGMLKQLSDEDATPAKSIACMEAFYRVLPMALSAAIREIFEAIASGRVPLVFHCSAGKDRTGVVAGLLLDALGVPRDMILADYARSATLMDYEAILSGDPDSSLGLSRDGFSLARLPRGIRAPLLASDPRYLAATFAEIETESGSIEGYLIHKIGVAPNHLTRVRAELLA